MNPRSRWLGGACLLLVLSGCMSEAPRIGVVVSQAAITSAELAARPGDGGAIELRVEYPRLQADAEPALQTAERLVAGRVIAVVGHSNSEASLAASQVYNRSQVVQLAPTTTAAAYADAGPYSFRMVPSDVAQARLLARAAVVLGRGTPVAVMYENDEYGWGLLRELRAAADSLTLPVEVAAGYMQGESVATVRAVLESLLRQPPKVLLWLGRGIPLDSLQARLRTAGVTVIASDGLDTRRTYANRDGTFTGTYFVRLLDPAVEARAAATLSGLDVAARGAEGLLTYDAVKVLRAAVAAGATDGASVRAYLLSLGRSRPAYPGLTGEIRFDGERAVPRPWRLAQVTDRNVVAVDLEPER